MSAIEMTEAITNLQAPELYINRELSWLEFNRRVLEEAKDHSHPLLERAKFISIFSSNLDEYFMVRVSGLQVQLKQGVTERPADGMSPAEQLAAIYQIVDALVREQRQLLQKEILPALEAAGIHLRNYADLRPEQRAWLDDYFEREIFPVLTPLAFDPGHPFPHISNLSLNLAVVIRDPHRVERFARLKVPALLPRLVQVPMDCERGKPMVGQPACLVWLEQLISANLGSLFPGMRVEEAHVFRVTRDADLEIRETEASDLMTTVEEGVYQRQFGSVVRLAVETTMPAHIREVLIENMEMDKNFVYVLESPLGLRDLIELHRLDRPDLKDSSFTPKVPTALRGANDLFGVIQHQDVMLHHPFDSFMPVVDFIRAAAHDPAVLAIKQTLYRVGTDSPIVKALMEARENDKQVAVLVELKARFDEESNIEWARALEAVGVHVVYGLIGLKTHCKLALVVRKEREGIRRYVHVGTGNYNATTARLYTDVGILTANPEIGADVSELFNYLTGYSNQREYRRVLVAPVNLRQNFERLIAREMELGPRGRLLFKMNSLSDPGMVATLYRAAQAGVEIDLLVRGVCCLRPGVPGLSETIRVRSLVGRFLEHSRIYVFGNDGNAEVFIGSADLMRRNLDRRVEVVAPVLDATIRSYIIEHLLEAYRRDCHKSWWLDRSGRYQRVQPLGGGEALSAQDWLLSH
jgi:polyphosphate kinase